MESLDEKLIDVLHLGNLKSYHGIYISGFLSQLDIYCKLFCLSKLFSTVFFPKHVHLLGGYTYMMFKKWYDGFLPSFNLQNLKSMTIGIVSYYLPNAIPELDYISLNMFNMDNMLTCYRESPGVIWTPPSVTTLTISGMPMTQEMAYQWRDSENPVEFFYKVNVLPLSISQFVVSLSLDKCFFRNIDFSTALSLKELWLGDKFYGSISRFPPNLTDLGIMNYSPYTYDEELDELCVSYTSIFAPMGTKVLYIGPIAPVMVTWWTPTLRKVYLPMGNRIVKYELPDGEFIEEEMIDAPFPDGFKAKIIYY